MIHQLKTIPKYFEDVRSGRKSFEVRKNDRQFRENDLLALNEYDPDTNTYTGRSCVVYVDYMNAVNVWRCSYTKQATASK